MLVHLRLVVPADRSREVARRLAAADTVTNVVHQPGVCIDPPGDLIEVDVAREAASGVIDELRHHGICDDGSIVVSNPSATPFRRAGEIERAAIGDPDDAVIWDEVQEAAEDGVRSTISFHVFLAIAVALAGVALITDSPVLVVGAMVVGPEFATVAGICAGLVLRNRGLVGRGVRLLVLGFALAIAVNCVLAFVGARTGLLSPDLVSRPRPQTDFVWNPDRWSFVVALLAGAAGVLALSVDRAQAMVGVFISVTTVPAAGNMALGLALWMPHEIVGSAQQLGINLLGMTIAGTLTLVAQRVLWRRVGRMTRPVG